MTVAQSASRGDYYNEIEPYAAQWIRNLIAKKLIPAGDVDERSIVDVRPDDLAGYRQCHFFAGIGGWALAARLAGWPDDLELWTGSCPCQPFSAAGKGAGFADERHLWPSFHWLIQQRRPAIVLGEQVASKAADDWIDLVHADMEGVGYAFGCIPFPSAGIGAPHIRDRNYWVAHADGMRFQGFGGDRENGASEHRQIVGLADTHGGQQQGLAVVRGHVCDGENAGRQEGRGCTTACGVAERLAHPHLERSLPSALGGVHSGQEGAGARDGEPKRCGTAGLWTSPLHGFWRAADWLACRDGKWRPVEPGTQPLAHGIPARVGRLRAYGNAINPYQAAEFIRAVMAVRP